MKRCEAEVFAALLVLLLTFAVLCCCHPEPSVPMAWSGKGNRNVEDEVEDEIEVQEGEDIGEERRGGFEDLEDMMDLQTDSAFLTILGAHAKCAQFRLEVRTSHLSKMYLYLSTDDLCSTQRKKL